MWPSSTALYSAAGVARIISTHFTNRDMASASRLKTPASTSCQSNAPRPLLCANRLQGLTAIRLTLPCCYSHGAMYTEMCDQKKTTQQLPRCVPRTLPLEGNGDSLVFLHPSKSMVFFRPPQGDSFVFNIDRRQGLSRLCRFMGYQE